MTYIYIMDGAFEVVKKAPVRPILLKRLQTRQRSYQDFDEHPLPLTTPSCYPRDNVCNPSGQPTAGRCLTED